MNGIDPLSSARWFVGWREPPPLPDAPPPTAEARTWLARSGWKRKGALARDEKPATLASSAG